MPRLTFAVNEAAIALRCLRGERRPPFQEAASWSPSNVSLCEGSTPYTCYVGRLMAHIFYANNGTNVALFLGAPRNAYAVLIRVVGGFCLSDLIIVYNGGWDTL